MGKGFKPQRKRYNLEFEGELDGLRVTARGMSLRDYMRMGTLLESDDKTDVDSIRDLDELFELFARALVSWNLEDDDGNPTPATKDGMYDQEISLVISIISAYVTAVSGVPDPLDGPASSGETSPAVPLPMEALSPNPPN